MSNIISLIIKQNHFTKNKRLIEHTTTKGSVIDGQMASFTFVATANIPRQVQVLSKNQVF